MKKPISKWALGIWAVALFYVVVCGVDLFMTPHFILSTVTGTTIWATFLVGLGALIELLDQILWEIRNRK